MMYRKKIYQLISCSHECREVSEADWSKVVSPKLRARLGKMQDAVSWGKGKAGQVAAMTPQMAVKAMKGGGKAVAAGMEKAKSIMGSANRKSSGKYPALKLKSHFSRTQSTRTMTREIDQVECDAISGARCIHKQMRIHSLSKAHPFSEAER